jgi:hypothetical protein
MSERSVWKFAIEVSDEFQLIMPKGAKPLYVGVQRVSEENARYDQPCLWALVDPDAEAEKRTFFVHGTGHPVRPGLEYVGSFMLWDGEFVGHLFQPRSLIPTGGVFG